MGKQILKSLIASNNVLEWYYIDVIKLFSNPCNFYTNLSSFDVEISKTVSKIRGENFFKRLEKILDLISVKYRREGEKEGRERERERERWQSWNSDLDSSNIEDFNRQVFSIKIQSTAANACCEINWEGTLMNITISWLTTLLLVFMFM